MILSKGTENSDDDSVAIVLEGIIKVQKRWTIKDNGYL